MKRVVICLHGLIKDAPHDFVPFKKYVEELNLDFEVDLLMLYDICDKKTFKFKNKVKLLHKVIAEYEEKGYEIILVGYSFSCGLCAKMAKKHKISKIILVSPVFKILTRKGIKYYFGLFFKSFKLRAKATVNKKKRNRLKKMNSLYLFDLLASCFYSLSRTNKLYKNIKCPLFIMFGEFDDISEPNLIGKIRKQVHHNVNVDIKFYKGANHVFIMSNKVDKIPYYNDMISFVNE